MSAYTYYMDPGHGWLEVPMAEIVSLGIDEKISRYSYRDGDRAYLEEDCDLTMFAAAKMGKNPTDWKAAMRSMTDEDWLTFNAYVIENSEAANWGAPPIFIRALPSYYH